MSKRHRHYARRRKKKKLSQQERLEAARQLLGQYDLSGLSQRAGQKQRRFILHVGPTNSGKTYEAMEALKNAISGAYLGPLRLLALEVFDKLNAEGCPCTLLTGEEYEPVPCARHVASTIELCDFSQEYDAVVIDEAQMIADPSRGAAWTRAILGVNAAAVHLCLAPEAEPVIRTLLDSFAAPYEIRRHRRLVPLVFSGTVKGLDGVQPGDALITFSRSGVLNVAAALEQKGVAASVIYGTLPPASRREEVRKFAQGETGVVVATDAIGMGISLPIRRVIFCQTVKYDGVERRPLTWSEIRQIAGRAGRYGFCERGEVLTMSDPELVETALRCQPKAIRELTLPFPQEALDSEFDIPTLLKAWETLPPLKRLHRADLSEALILYKALDPALLKGTEKETVFRYISCPVDTGNRDLVRYWRDCAAALLQDWSVPQVPFGDEDLESCELRYKALDVRHQMLRRAGIEENVRTEQERLARRINELLREDKSAFLRRCPRCRRLLAFDYPGRLCERCQRQLEKKRTEMFPERMERKQKNS